MQAQDAKEQASDPALKQFYLASAAYNRRLYPAAISQYSDFLKKYSTHTKADHARYGLGISLYAMKQYEKAIPQFATLLAKKNLANTFSRERLVMLQGQCLLHGGKKDEAKKLFVGAVDQFKDGPFKVAAIAAVADISFSRAAWDDVINWTTRVVASKSSPSADQLARALYQQGFAHHQLKKYNDAIVSLAKVTPLKSSAIWQTRSAYLLGECYSITSQLEQAEVAFAASLDGLVGGDADECRFRLGHTRFQLKKYAEASVAFTAYLKHAKDGPRQGESNLYIGRCLLEQADFKQAERKLSQISSGTDIVAAKASLWLARVYSRQKENFDRAAQVLASATEKFKKSAVIDELDFDYANALMSQRTPDWKKAAAAFSRIERRRKFRQMPEVISQWAVCMHKAKDYNQSMSLNDRFIKAYTDSRLLGDVRFMRAENLYLLRRGDDAAKAYSEYIHLHKEHPSAMAAAFRVAQIFHDKGEWDKSLASAKPLLARKPQGRLFSQLSFIVGDSLFRQSKWDQAVAPLEAFVATRVQIDVKRKRRKVQADPNVDTALMQLAVAFDHLDQKEKALDHLLTLTAFFPGESAQLPLALTEQGRLAYETGDLRLAKQALDRFVSEFKGNKASFKKRNATQRAKVHYYLAWVHVSEARHKEGADHFGEVVKLSGHQGPLSPDAALQQGIAYVKLKDFETASKHFKDMMNRFRDHKDIDRVTYYGGLSMARLKDWRNASGMFKQVVDKYKESDFVDEALYEWAWCERAMKRKPEAIKRYEQLLASYPKSQLVVKVQSELAELNLDKGMQDKVIAQLTATLENVTDETLREDIRYQLASAYFKKGDAEASAPMFEKLIVDYPKSKLLASMRFQAGESRFTLKETIKAREHFQAGLKISGMPEPLAESMMMRLGETQNQSAEYKAAYKTYRAFLGKFRESQWKRNAQFGLAFAMEMDGKSQNAIGEYQKLLASETIDLWSVRARYQVGECYFNVRNYEQAKVAFLHVEVHYKKYPSWQAKSVFEMARVLLAQKKNEEAMSRFKDVIKRFPKEKAAIASRQYLDKLRSN